jgi:hypothetical protein
MLLPQSLVSRYEQLPNGYPLVLVQLPMYNEEAHCEVVIERACRMEWPRDRLVIQVSLPRACGAALEASLPAQMALGVGRLLKFQ